jgi:flavorubredoxin
MKEIAKGILYIGTDDTQLDLFESQYVVPEGMAYNSYLIKDEKYAVLDTVDRRKGEDWLRNLKEALEGRAPDYLVVHHMEPDHSALIGELAALYPQMQIVASAKAIQLLGQFQPGQCFNTLAVKEGDSLSLGTCQLRFFAAPMVHWPEVLVSFEPSTGTLFSADAFGKVGDLSVGIIYAVPRYAKKGNRFVITCKGAVVVNIIQSPTLGLAGRRR